jgi:hypothetical protein
MARVRGVSAAATASACSWNPSASWTFTETGSASAYFTNFG